MGETAILYGVFEESTIDLGPRCSKFAVLIPVLNATFS